MTRWLAMMFCGFALVAAGCGGDDDEDEAGRGDGQAEPPAEETAGGEMVRVAMKDIAFDPKKLTVDKGTTIEWTNEDTVGHDVTKTAGPGPDFKSGPPGAMMKGDTFDTTLTTPGKIDYVCTVHANMKASITVR